MPLLTAVDIGETIKKHRLIEIISDKEINVAKQKFDAMRKAGVITGEFSDDTWYMTNETETTGIDYNFNEIAIYKQKNTTYDKFVLDVKSYICFCFGNYTLLMFPRLVNAIKNAVVDTDCFTKMPSDIKSLQLPGVGDFLSLLPWVEEDFLFSQANNSYEFQRRRSLAEYKSYFVFNDLMTRFWSTASDDEKDFYYPLYLWWNISMIIPIRVTEFSVIPKQCLELRDGKWYLTIRRTSIKGRTDLKKRYQLKTDYAIYSYEITDRIASDIMDYQRRVVEVGEAEIDSMFSDKLFSEAKKKLIPRAKSPVIYPHMRISHFDIVLDYFYICVVEKIYHYSVCKKDIVETADENGQGYELMPHEIVKLNLGDTRHIALQNMLLNGCNLLMAKEISGHDTIDMIYHYSGNMKNLIKCKAYGLYELGKRKTSTLTIMGTSTQAEMVLREKNRGSYIQMDNGRCYSPRFVQEYDASDCFAVAGNCAVCIFHEGNDDLSSECEEQEKQFEEKAARVKIWMSSLKKLKDKEQIMIAGEEMTTAAKNLEMLYLKRLQLGGQL